MRRSALTRTALLCCVLLAAGAVSSCRQAPAVTNVPRLQSAIDKTMKTMNCPGVVFAVTAPGKSAVIITKGVDDLQTRA
ncbi:MAG TPA: hypothetical protein VIK02_01780 [Candidatus Anoxymicrobiaceae bacterium]